MSLPKKTSIVTDITNGSTDADIAINISNSSDAGSLQSDTQDECTMEEGVPIDDDGPLDVSNRRQQLVDAGFLTSRRAQNQAEDEHRHGFAVPSTADEMKVAKARWGEDAWQMKALKFINSDAVQRFLIGLLVMDVLILFSELGK